MGQGRQTWGSHVAEAVGEERRLKDGQVGPTKWGMWEDELREERGRPMWPELAGLGACEARYGVWTS